MLARLFLKTVFTRSQKARALNFKSSFAAQQKAVCMKASSQAVPAVRELERQRKDSAFKFNAEVALL